MITFLVTVSAALLCSHTFAASSYLGLAQGTPLGGFSQHGTLHGGLIDDGFYGNGASLVNHGLPLGHLPGPIYGSGGYLDYAYGTGAHFGNPYGKARFLKYLYGNPLGLANPYGALRNVGVGGVNEADDETSAASGSGATSGVDFVSNNQIRDSSLTGIRGLHSSPIAGLSGFHSALLPHTSSVALGTHPLLVWEDSLMLLDITTLFLPLVDLTLPFLLQLDSTQVLALTLRLQVWVDCLLMLDRTLLVLTSIYSIRRSRDRAVAADKFPCHRECRPLVLTRRRLRVPTWDLPRERHSEDFRNTTLFTDWCTLWKSIWKSKVFQILYGNPFGLANPYGALRNVGVGGVNEAEDEGATSGADFVSNNQIGDFSLSGIRGLHSSPIAGLDGFHSALLPHTSSVALGTHPYAPGPHTSIAGLGGFPYVGGHHVSLSAFSGILPNVGAAGQFPYGLQPHTPIDYLTGFPYAGVPHAPLAASAGFHAGLGPYLSLAGLGGLSPYVGPWTSRSLATSAGFHAGLGPYPSFVGLVGLSPYVGPCATGAGFGRVNAALARNTPNATLKSHSSANTSSRNANKQGARKQ
ncbi:hypothetical protein C7M84_009345 [Penaeus vannamei]|uniref:Uncharacterized protein n=1 Tax=Penaeus vannamei TaxID=6689 RepID=A0A423T744_PENVA|nr:hypothetical protein C7M84_009345 [Penaeus vannamei]